MKTNRVAFALTTDTGANASATAGPIMGRFLQVVYDPGDTGVRMDTGAVLTVTMDTGEISLPMLVAHLAPNTKPWARAYKIPSHDTGGNALLYAGGGEPVAEFFYISGDKVTASVQGIATDTGKTPTIYLYHD